MDILQTVYTVVIALLVFGFLILIHEFGHFIAAKKCGVRVNEFSIGMGPLVWSTQRGETQYSLRALPVGGYVSMEGEAESSGDSRAFCNQSPLRRFIIMVAGAAMNILLGYLLMLTLTMMSNGIATPVIHSFDADAVTSQFLQPGDRILRLDGNRIRTANDITFYMMRDADGIMDVQVLRDGQTVDIPQARFKTTENEGVTFIQTDFIVVGQPKTLFNVPVYAADWTLSVGKQVWFSLWDLIFSDRYGVEQVSGPVGTATAIGTASTMGLESFLMMLAIITLNLGVFNLLPLPALDGGRIFLVLIEVIRRKPIDPKVEGYINTAGFVALMGLMLFVTFNDIRKFF